MSSIMRELVQAILASRQPQTAATMSARPRVMPDALAAILQGPLQGAYETNTPHQSDTLGYPVDLSRPYVDIPGGGVGTEYQMTVPAESVGGTPGAWVNIPSIWDGSVRGEDEATRRARAAGTKRGEFKDIPSAEREAIARSRYIGFLRGMSE